MKVTVHALNAFAKTSTGGSPEAGDNPEAGGNPAGVVLEADGLTGCEMQRAAAEAGFSETAFIERSEKADVKVRFFTPAAEVDICGHATIAAFSLLARRSMLPVGKYTQETKAGILPVEIRPGGVIFMGQSRPRFFETVSGGELALSLNMPEDFLMKAYPAGIVSTGLRDILIPVNTLGQLLSIRPDFDRVRQTSGKYGVVGYHVFTLETKYGSTAHCRNFAPAYGIPEEAATGTSNGALGCYLFHHGLISEDEAEHLVFEQGYSMGRPSEILACLAISGKEIVEVRVGGIALGLKKAEIEL